MTEEFPEFCFSNVIDIKRYERETSFYKDCIEHIDDEAKLEYRYESTFGKRQFNMKLQSLIDFAECEF